MMPIVIAPIQQVRVEIVREVFPSDAAMAAAFRVDRSRVGRWRRGEPMDEPHREFLENLDATIAKLKGFLDESVISEWLRGVNAHLGDRRPIDVLRTGRLSEVIAAIEAERSGAFA
jgi:hypothetical protein